jgi:Acetyltransferase (GNAT) domain
MVLIRTLRGPFHLIEAYFAQPSEVQGLGDMLPLNGILHIRQALTHLPHHKFALHYRPFASLELDLTRSSEELFGEMAQTSRYEINRAERERADIEVHRNDARAYRDFHTVYNNFVALKKHTARLSKRLFDALEPYADVSVASFRGRPVCGHVSVRDETLRRVALVWSASTRLSGEFSSTFVGRLNRWLHWHEIALYKLEGIHVYDFGGTGADTQATASIARFKQMFGGKDVKQHDYIMARGLGRIAVQFFLAIRQIRER